MPKLTYESSILKQSTASKLRRPNSDLKKQIASYAEKLHSINRLLGSLSVCIQEVLEASRELLDALQFADGRKLAKSSSYSDD